jgi:hypothetical protein
MAKAGMPGATCTLHVDRPHLNALKGNCGDALDHLGLPQALSSHTHSAQSFRRTNRARIARFALALRNHNG